MPWVGTCQFFFFSFIPLFPHCKWPHLKEGGTHIVLIVMDLNISSLNQLFSRPFVNPFYPSNILTVSFYWRLQQRPSISRSETLVSHQSQMRNINWIHMNESLMWMVHSTLEHINDERKCLPDNYGIQICWHCHSITIQIRFSSDRSNIASQETESKCIIY